MKEFKDQMSRRTLPWILICIFMSAGLSAVAEPLPGKSKSTTCQACHGVKGVSSNDQWPNLAGQKQQYLIEQLKSFRSGVRDNSLMSPVAKMLTDEDIKDLAEYYAAGAP